MTFTLDSLAQGEHSFPERLILDDGKISLTYSEFATCARTLSRQMQERGVGKGDRIAILTRDPAPAFVGMFAAWMGGATAVPLTLSQPESIWRECLQRVAPSLAFVQGFPPSALDVPTLSLERLKGEKGGPLPLTSDAGLILFTSGSTGNPKGVLLGLETVLENARRTSLALGLAGEDRILINTPHYYTSAILHFLTLLSAGGGTVVRSGFFFGPSLWQEIAVTKCTGFGGAPTHFIRLFENAPAALPPRMRFMVSSGDHLPRENIKRIISRYPNLQLFSFYGLTEVGGRLCFLPPSELPGKAGSVGRPLEGMKVTIRRADGTPSLPGETGEVFVTGPLLMRGYHQDNRSTSEALTPTGLRTGDLGYQDAEGCLWLLGREDGVFKSGAEKVSTQFITETLSKSDLIKEIVVIATNDPILGKVPQAYVVPAIEFDLDALKRFARVTLPASHIPKKWSVVENIPRTGSGKVIQNDLRGLKVRDHDPL